MFYHEDWPEASSNLNSKEDITGLDIVDDNWIEMEQSNRVFMLIDERIKEISCNDGVLTSDDWESIVSF